MKYNTHTRLSYLKAKRCRCDIKLKIGTYNIDVWCMFVCMYVYVCMDVWMWWVWWHEGMNDDDDDDDGGKKEHTSAGSDVGICCNGKASQGNRRHRTCSKQFEDLPLFCAHNTQKLIRHTDKEKAAEFTGITTQKAWTPTKRKKGRQTVKPGEKNS